MYFEADHVKEIPLMLKKQADYIFVEEEGFTKVGVYPRQRINQSNVNLEEEILIFTDTLTTPGKTYDYDIIKGTVVAEGVDGDNDELVMTDTGGDIILIWRLFSFDIITVPLADESLEYEGYELHLSLHEDEEGNILHSLEDKVLTLELPPNETGTGSDVLIEELMQVIESYDRLSTANHRVDEENWDQPILLSNMEEDEVVVVADARMVNDLGEGTKFHVMYDLNRLSGVDEYFDISEGVEITYDYKGISYTRNIASVFDFIVHNPGKKVVVLRENGSGETFNF